MSARSYFKTQAEAGGRAGAQEILNTYQNMSTQNQESLYGTVQSVDHTAGTVTVLMQGSKRTVTVSQGSRWLGVGDKSWVFGNRAN